MRVKQGLWFAIGLILLVPLLYFIGDRTIFMLRSQEAHGSVVEVQGKNDRCGGSRRRRRYDCTKFTAGVSYEVRASQYRISVSAGKTRGHDQPLSAADYAVGDSVPVVYSPRSPQRAYRNSIWDVWGAPIMLFIFQVGSFFAAFTEKRR